MRPRRVRGHEVDRLGRRELRGDHEVALVLAVGVVDDDDEAALADLLDRLLDRWRTGVVTAMRRQASARRTASRRSTYFASTSASRFTGSPGSSSPSVVAARVCGTSATAKPAVVERGDREARAVDRDRALLDHVAEELGRRVDPDARPSPSRLDARTAPTAVDVALDVVAAERLAGPQRRLEVDARPGREARRARCARASRARRRRRCGRPSIATAVRQTPLDRRPSRRSAIAARRLGRLDLEPERRRRRPARRPRPTSRTIPVNTRLG